MIRLPKIGEVWRYAIHETILTTRKNGDPKMDYHFNYQTGETREVTVTKENIQYIIDELDFHSYRFLREKK